MSEGSLRRFISGKTDKLGDENIIRIARAFDVSTDFLLGEVDEPDRKNYDISELGLSPIRFLPTPGAQRKRSKPQKKLALFWWARRDLNPHVRSEH